MVRLALSDLYSFAILDHVKTKNRWILAILGLALVAGIGLFLTRNPNAFDQIYLSGGWGTNESGEGTSGSGSTEEVTREYRAFLENLIREEGIQSVVDAGSGDWEFSHYIDWGEADYLGIDISSVVLERAKERYEGPKVHFRLGSATDELPPRRPLDCERCSATSASRGHSAIHP